MLIPIKHELHPQSADGREHKAWLVAADMGYGHLRAVEPLRDLAKDEIAVVGNSDADSIAERKLWSQLLMIYELMSRAHGLPLIGRAAFKLLDTFLYIPSLYPIRNLSRPTFQVNFLASFIKRGLCSGVLRKIMSEDLPLVTSFYAPAIAADMAGYEKIYCIICDADLNRVWVAAEPSESRIDYFAPCGKAAQRLRAYGVPTERIFLTGFPLPEELLGGPDLPVLRRDLGQRLRYLDPQNRFWPLHSRNVEHFLGAGNCSFNNDRKLTITYAVGGAGAQKEIGLKIAKSLRKKLQGGEIFLNLVAGTKRSVKSYFDDVKSQIDPNGGSIRVIYGQTPWEYFTAFNEILHTTDILWTKPSELSFYSGLGLPIIMSPAIGSQEYFNRQWLLDIHAGIRQEKPEFTDQWLFDMLDNGTFADAGWSGFLKARKLGTYRIREILDNGKMSQTNSPLQR
jgi:hypothetical protein